MSSIIRGITINAVIVILAFLFSALLYVGYVWYQSLDPQGEATDNCEKVELPSVPNGAGMVVTAHNTACSGYAGSSAIYVYVHKVGEVESSDSLVFRYFESSSEGPPKIEWTNSNALRISVGEVSEVTKQLNSMDGVAISYAIGGEEFPRDK